MNKIIVNNNIINSNFDLKINNNKYGKSEVFNGHGTQCCVDFLRGDRRRVCWRERRVCP